MPNMQSIHTFATKYLSLFQSEGTTDYDLHEPFGEECFDLGFDMDCGKNFCRVYGDDAFNDYIAFDRIKDDITDVMILGSGIFSYWRYITHWSYQESLLSDENRKWFILAFSRLLELTDEKGESNHMSNGIERNVKDKVQQLIRIVAELEKDFPGRHFTLDGHLVGSIGEVMAEYYYGIKLCKASQEIYDGEVDDKKIQIKITQRDTILISHKPEYLIALYLSRSGEIYEIYNGPGDVPWESVESFDSHNYKHLRVNKLMELDRQVDDADRIAMINKIEKMKAEYKNI